MISVDGLTVEFGGTTLFKDISFAINEKDRIALMGKNGAGKSTMLKIIAGEKTPSRGRVTAPKDAVIALDVGENQWWFGRNFKMKEQRFAMSGYLGTMGFGFPAAIAAKIAWPEKIVFCITGEGGFAMAMSDFITAVKYNLPMVVVILSNRQFGMIQVEKMIENYATDLLNPDFSEYAKKCGGGEIRVQNPEDLKPALIMAIKSKIPYIVDIQTDPRRFIR